MRLHDEPEPVAGDGPDAEGGHDDGEVLSCLHQPAQDVRVRPEWPVALQGGPEGEGGREAAEEEV